MKLVPLAALFLLTALAPQEMPADPPRKFRVVSVQRQEHDFLVTLRGETEAADGVRLIVTATPRSYQVGADGTTLVSTVRTGSSATALAEVRKGGYDVKFRTPFLRECLVQTAPRPGFQCAPAEEWISLIDPATFARKHSHDHAQVVDRIRDFHEVLAALIPYGEAEEGKKVPNELLQKLQVIEHKTRFWAERSEIQGTGLHLTQLISEVLFAVPWEGAMAYAEGDQLPIPHREERKGGRYDVGGYQTRLDRMKEFALRETLLALLIHVADVADRVRQEEKESRAPAVRKGIRSLADYGSTLAKGKLGETFEAYPPASEAVALAGQVSDYLQGLPAEGQPLEEVRRSEGQELLARLREMRLRVEGVPGPEETSAPEKKE